MDDPQRKTKQIIIKERELLRRQNKRLKLIERLGGRCSSLDCCWINSDGTRGCSDPRALQIDHKNGGGVAERRDLGSYQMSLKIEATLDIYEHFGDMSECPYQLLCANCNWIKRHRLKEYNRGPIKDPNITELLKDIKLLPNFDPLHLYKTQPDIAPTEPDGLPVTDHEYVTPGGIQVRIDYTSKRDI